MPVRLIATDIDGTLLNNASDIPRENVEIIRESQQRGIPVVSFKFDTRGAITFGEITAAEVEAAKPRIAEYFKKQRLRLRERYFKK